MKKAPLETKKVINKIKEFLNEDDIRFWVISDSCLELHFNGENLNMQLLINIVNDHLVITIPNFIRNISLKNLNIMLLIHKIMREVLDVRLSIDEEGTGLSSSIHHVLEDNTITKKQFDFMMTILIGVTDDIYPLFMQSIYSRKSNIINTESIIDELPLPDFNDLDDEVEDLDEVESDNDRANKDNKIN